MHYRNIKRDYEEEAAFANFKSPDVKLPVDVCTITNFTSSLSIFNREFLTASKAPFEPAFKIILNSLSPILERFVV